LPFRLTPGSTLNVWLVEIAIEAWHRRRGGVDASQVVAKAASIHGLPEMIRAEVATPHCSLDVAMTQQRFHRDEINS